MDLVGVFLEKEREVNDHGRKNMDKIYIVVLNSTTYGKWGTLKGYAQGSGNYP